MTQDQNSLPRRQAREIAFQFLYGSLPAPQKESGVSPALFSHTEFELFCINFVHKMDEFAWELIEGTGKNLPSLDETIAKVSAHWRIERMPRVDLTIARLGGFEILFRPDIPKTVAINEAVELAKRYGAEDSAAFINGILDKFTKPA